MSLQGLIRRRLGALGFPGADEFDFEDRGRLVSAVVFLEDRKVRLWAIAEREPLRRDGAHWNGTFAKLLLDAGCPFLEDEASFEPAQTGSYLAWLCGNAISLDYEDNASAFNAGASEAIKARGSSASATAAAAAAAAGGGAGGGSASSSALATGPLTSLGSATATSPVPGGASPAPALPLTPEFHAMLDELCALMHVSSTEVATTAADDERTRAALRLRACLNVLRQRILTVVTPAGEPLNASEDDKAAPDAAAKTHPSLDSFPVGFDTGDSVLDRAATILRMLYIADLRDLQDRINRVMETAQSFTADPRTDAKLGRVGR